MSFDWRLYLQLANELITLQRTQILQEAYSRSAISRAYYAVFCIARNHLKNRGITIPQRDTHKFVRETYKQSRDRREKQIGSNLGRLWQHRKDADYEDGANIDKSRAELAYEMAQRILGSLQNIRAI